MPVKRERERVFVFPFFLRKLRHYIKESASFRERELKTQRRLGERETGERDTQQKML